MNIKNTALVTLLFFCLILFFFELNNHAFIYPDSFGYLFPAAKKIDGDGLQLIYGRTFGFPYLLSLLSYNFFEIQLSFLNLLFYFTTPILLTLCFYKFSNTNDSKISQFIKRLLFIVIILFFFSNIDHKQWFYFIAPEGLSSFLLGISFFLFLILNKKNPYFMIFFLIFIFASGYLIITKPAFLFYSIFILLAFFIKNYFLQKNRSIKNTSFFIFLATLIFLALIVINKSIVQKYDLEMSERFKAGSLFCSNLDIIQKSPNAINNVINNSNVIYKFEDHLDLLIHHEDKVLYPLLGFNQDYCLYSNQSIFQFFDNYYERKDTSVILKKLTILSILENPILFFKRIFKQYIYVFLNPWSKNISENIIISDSAMESFNRGVMQSNFIDYFWSNHDWRYSKNISNPLKIFYLPNILFIFVILLNFLSNVFLMYRSRNNKNLLTEKIKVFISNFLLPLLTFSALMLAVATFGSFDVPRYTHTNFTATILIFYYFILTAINNFDDFNK